MTLVLDASLCLAWCLGDGGDQEAMSLLKRLASEGAIVPALWVFEVENGLRSAVRRGRITEAEASTIAGKLSALPIRVADSTEQVIFHNAIALANRFDLSVYDAAYLDVALRWKAALATSNPKLAEASRQLGVAFKRPRKKRANRGRKAQR